MDNREEKIKRLKEARSKYADLTRLKLNKTTSSREFNLGQMRKIENNFKPLQENYNKILENNMECSTPISYHFSLKPKQSIIGMKMLSSYSKGKSENIENVAVTDAGKRRAMELLQTIARKNDTVSDFKNFSKKSSDCSFVGQQELNEESKGTHSRDLVGHFSINKQSLVDGNTNSVKKSKSSRRVCFADDFIPLTCNRDKILSNNFECETPVSSRLSKQPKQSIIGTRQLRSTNIPGITRSIDDVPVTDEGRKKAMEHLYRLIETSNSQNRPNV